MKNLDKLINTLQEIYSSGDRDECSHKHVINGMCQLILGGAPSDSGNYYDYGTCGIPWWFEDYDLPYEEWPERVFCEQLWINAEELYQNLSDNDKQVFLTDYNPFVFTNFKEDHSFWLDEYDKNGNTK